MCDISHDIFKIRPCMAAYSVKSRTAQRESRDELSYFIVLLMLKSGLPIANQIGEFCYSEDDDYK